MADECTTAEEAKPEFDPSKVKSIYEFTCKSLEGKDVCLDKYKGRVCIIVNVASKCGYTANHYKELNELYEQYNEKGLEILAFPCNQFGNQEPGDSEEIQCFLKKNQTQFDFFEKINVNGSQTAPLWSYLKYKQGGTLGKFIKWNFTKFIIDKNGQPVERHGPTTSPSDMLKSLQKYF